MNNMSNLSNFLVCFLKSAWMVYMAKTAKCHAAGIVKTMLVIELQVHAWKVV